MLRSAGVPKALSLSTERTLIAAIPAMRIQLLTAFAVDAIPAALHAFALWIGTLAELRQRDLAGEDLLALLKQPHGGDQVTIPVRRKCIRRADFRHALNGGGFRHL